MEQETFSLSHDLGELVEKGYKAGEIKIDWRGHCRGGQVRPEAIEHDLHFLFIATEATQTKWKAAIKATKTKTPLPQPLKINHGMLSCYDCGDWMRWEFDGVTLRARSECKFKNGLQPTVFDLNIPSGRLIVANDLRDLFRIAGDYNVNTTLGLVQTTEKYAEAGLAHGFVGNTCPGVYKLSGKNTHFVLGPGPYPGCRRVAGVCTDLWWYSICDGDELDRRLKERKYKNLKKVYQEHNIDVVKCKPGVYRFSQEYHTLDDRDRKQAVYARWEWTAAPQPVKDYEAHYKSLDFTAGQLIRDSISRYPGLYDNDTDNTIESVQRVADHIFLTNGNGLEIHPNGWIGDAPDLDPNAPDMDIPLLEGKFRWYPGGDWCYLAHCAGFAHPFYANRREGSPDLNESFTALAFNICHNIITYGGDTIGQQNKKRATQEANALNRLARRALKALALRYPSRVPDYCKAILKKMRVKYTKPAT